MSGALSLDADGYSSSFGGEGAEMSPAAVVSIPAAVTDDTLLMRKVAYQALSYTRTMHAVTLGEPAAADMKINRGDLVFEDLLQRSVHGYSSLGASQVPVFSSFRGMRVQLPDAVDVDNNRIPDAAQYQIAKAALQEHYAKHVRLVGVSLSSYVPGDMRQSNSGVAVAVSGKISVTNTASGVVKAGDLLMLELPTFADVGLGVAHNESPGAEQGHWLDRYDPTDPGAMETRRLLHARPRLKVWKPKTAAEVVDMPGAAGGGATLRLDLAGAELLLGDVNPFDAAEVEAFAAEMRRVYERMRVLANAVAGGGAAAAEAFHDAVGVISEVHSQGVGLTRLQWTRLPVLRAVSKAAPGELVECMRL